MLPCICPVIFRSQMTWKCGKNKKVAHEAIVSRSTFILRRRKVEFIKSINLRNVLFFGFVKFEIMQWFTVNQDQFCLWLSLARLPTAGVFFLWVIFSSFMRASEQWMSIVRAQCRRKLWYVDRNLWTEICGRKLWTVDGSESILTTPPRFGLTKV